MRYKQREGERVEFTQDEENEWGAMVEARPAVLAKRAIENTIYDLEAEVTPDRMMAAFIDPAWMNAQRALISVEKERLESLENA